MGFVIRARLQPGQYGQRNESGFSPCHSFLPNSLFDQTLFAACLAHHELASRKTSMRLVPVFLGAGAEKNARQKDDRDDRNNDVRGMKVHGCRLLVF
jgi:hypothetical protein